MSKLRKYYYSNKNQIWKNILIIVSVFIVIQIVNYNVRNKYNKNSNNIKNEVNNMEFNITTNKNIIVDNESLISNTKQETNESYSKIIESFFEYCFNNEIERAYNLLSDDCKEEKYKSLLEFENLYFKNKFLTKTEKIVSIENWSENIYKVNIVDDIIKTGNTNNVSIQDYITVVLQNEEIKLNINSFIKKEEIDKTISSNDIKITIISKWVYMDYEEYNIKIENNSNNIIMLDTKKSTKTMYIVDENNIKYYSQSHEVLDGTLKVNSGFSSQIRIKYSRTYSISRSIKSLVFSNVILNYNEYLKGNVNEETIIVNL